MRATIDQQWTVESDDGSSETTTGHQEFTANLYVIGDPDWELFIDDSAPPSTFDASGSRSYTRMSAQGCGYSSYVSAVGEGPVLNNYSGEDNMGYFKYYTNWGEPSRMTLSGNIPGQGTWTKTGDEGSCFPGSGTYSTSLGVSFNCAPNLRYDANSDVLSGGCNETTSGSGITTEVEVRLKPY